jgi:diacylglycerol kinase family enzyme
MMPPLESPQRAGEAQALAAPVERKRMLVIANPYATTVSERLKSLVVYALQGRYEVHAVDTEGRDHATLLCRDAAADGYDVVVAFGGDGTVNEAANGLAGSATALTALPGGATNVYCRMLGIPNDVVDATEHLLRAADEWRPRALDLGSVNGRHFLFSSGFGLDAAVVRRVDAHPETKARFRHWYYAAAGLATFAREYVVHPPRIDLEVGGETVRGVTALVQTGDPYTYFSGHPLHVADDIALDDGTIAGGLLRRSRPYDVPTVLARLFSERRRVSAHRRVFEWHGAQHALCVSADGRPVPLQVDGDYIGDTVEARYEVLPGALTVLA